MPHPVVIVGAGPVGLMLACELGLAGVPAVVLERSARRNEQSRGMAINATVVELLAMRGLMEPLRDKGFDFPRAHFAHLWLDPSKLTEPHPVTFAVPHSQLERLLEERAIDLGVDLRRGAEVIGLEQDGAGVTIQVRADSDQYSLTTAYLVGCDGVDSTVRSLAGIAFPGRDFPFHGIVGDLTVAPNDPLVGLIGVNQSNTGFVTIAPTSEDTIRLMSGEFGVLPDDPDASVTMDELCASVTRITGTETTSACTPQWLQRWDARSRLAETYRRGAVFLAGDAAHIQFPLGGQALSTGFEDAMNLGWKLAAHVRGEAPDGLLDSYHAERYPVGRRTCLTTEAQIALLHPMDRVTPLREVVTELIQFAGVNDYLVRMVGGLDVRYPLTAAGSGAHPLLGRRLPDYPVNTNDGDTSLARLLARGRGLVLDCGDDRSVSRTVTGWTDRVDSIAITSTPDLAATALLLRPDGRVAWAADSGAGDTGLGEALLTWFGASR